MDAQPLLTLPAELPHWRSALAVAPAVVYAGAAALAARQQAPEAWRVARSASLAALALVAAGGLALAALGSGQGLGWQSSSVASIVAVLVAFVGWVIVRYSQPYLDGRDGLPRYAAALLATLAAVMVVVATNHLLVLALAWTATRLSLHRLLTFFDDRAPALAAAHKKRAVGLVADGAMLLACALLAHAFGTLRIDLLLQAASAATPLPGAAQAAVLLIVPAALLKCAQLPVHGWLIQVMEAPTPVSALLHAGVVNLGGVVLIKLAPLVAAVPAAMTLLVLVGAFTAVVAALVMSTRISIKVTLAWSTAAQMGFMLMQCGLGLWSMALLHLVAHSLYKAHAFLGAGRVVRDWLTRRLAPAPTRPGLAAVATSAACALGVAAAFAVGGALAPGAAPGSWVMGAIVALSMAPLWRPAAPRAWARVTAWGLLMPLLYFAVHAVLEGRVVADTPAAAGPAWMFAAAAFAALFALQTALAANPTGGLARALYPWCYGGLFLDEAVSRALYRLFPPPRPAAAPHAPLAALPPAH